MNKKAYHLDLTKNDIKSTKHAILPGDPFRVQAIARKFDPESVELAFKREYRSFLGKMNNVPILVTSTGIGGPSTAIAVEELAQLGVKTFLRIGTTGAIQKNIKTGDVIITTASVRLDGTSSHYAPVEYPAVADYQIINALEQAARITGIKAHAGITASSDTFYPGQERYDSYSGHVIKKLQGTLEEWRRLNVLNYEMESSTLLILCSVMGLKAGCVTGVVVNRVLGEDIKDHELNTGEENAVKVGIRAMKILAG